VPLLSYWDAWVDDSRLTVLNAVDAAEHGAEIATRTEFLGARRAEGEWRAELSGGRKVSAKAIVNAAGPWVAEVLGRASGSARAKARLVKGSHVVLPALYDGDQAYILQQPDGRVVFALPFLGGYTLVGTTDLPVDSPRAAPISDEETRYLCEAVNRYFSKQAQPSDVVWSYSGVRALFDDGEADAKAVTRDYRIELEDTGGAKLLSIFGGKITTARALAAEAVDRLRIDGACLTDSYFLPGGDVFPPFLAWLEDLSAWLPQPLLARLTRAYGTRLREVLGDANRIDDLGRHFGQGLYEAELRYLHAREFARTAQDVLWRRTKLGLSMTPKEHKGVERWMKDQGPS
jgi:glycerol-3-phosphate dehydrogenase